MNSTRKPLNLIKSPIFTNAPCKSTCLCNAPSLHTLKKHSKKPRNFPGRENTRALKERLRWVLVNVPKSAKKWVRSGFLGAKVGEHASKLRYFRNPCDRDPPKRNFKNLKFFKNPLKILNVYF